MKKFSLIILFVIVIFSILGMFVYRALDCNIWGLDNKSHVELIKTNNTKTLNNVQNLLLDYFNMMIITRDGNDYHIYLKNPKPCDVNNAIITIAHSKIFDRNIRFSPVTDIDNVLKANYTENLIKRLENTFESIDGVVHADVVMTDMQQLIFCEKCTIDISVVINAKKDFSHTEELRNMVKNIIFGLDLDIKEENINIEIIKSKEIE